MEGLIPDLVSKYALVVRCEYWKSPISDSLVFDPAVLDFAVPCSAIIESAALLQVWLLRLHYSFIVHTTLSYMTRAIYWDLSLSDVCNLGLPHAFSIHIR